MVGTRVKQRVSLRHNDIMESPSTLESQRPGFAPQFHHVLLMWLWKGCYEIRLCTVVGRADDTMTVIVEEICGVERERRWKATSSLLFQEYG